MLSIEQIEDLDERLRGVLDEQLTQILTHLNRDGRLLDLLMLLGQSDLLEPEPLYKCCENGKIVVLGESKVPEKVLLAVTREFGFEKDRFECHLGYNAAKTFNCRKMQWNPSYCLVLVGPMPHSGVGKGDDTSIIAAMENQEGFPPVMRLGSNDLQISKTDFRRKLSEAIEQKLVAS